MSITLAIAQRVTDPARLVDTELIELVGDGNERAFGVLYDRYSMMAYSLALRLLRSRPAAEDLVQEAFFTAWQIASGYSAGRGSVRTWLLAIVHHRAVDRLRAQDASSRRDDALRSVALVDTEVGDLTSETAVAHLQFGVVRRVIDNLPRDQRQVLWLSYFVGFTHSEIAEILNLPLGTVKGRLRLGLERLRHLLAWADQVGPPRHGVATEAAPIATAA